MEMLWNSVNVETYCSSKMGKHKTNTAKKAGPTASATVSRTPDTIDPNVTLRESSTN